MTFLINLCIVLAAKQSKYLMFVATKWLEEWL